MPLVNARYGVLETISEDDLVSRSVAVYGEWAQNELDLIRRFVAPGAVVVDGGAYIGTHALAFSRWVGRDGAVLCVEPNPAAIQCLSSCKARNHLDNLMIWQGALGDYVSFLGHFERPHDPRNLGSARVSFSTDTDSEASRFVATKTLDSFDLPGCDLIKLDVEGDEIRALRGAERTVIRHRPVIFSECNYLAFALPLLQWAKRLGYDVHGAVFDAFNQRNFFGSSLDLFGGNREASLVLVPSERREGFSQALVSPDILPVKGPDDLALLLFKKPQYPSEAVRLGPTPQEERHGERREARVLLPRHGRSVSLGSSKGEVEAAGQPVPARIIVSFYRQPQLVDRVFGSLQAIHQELERANTRVLFINDSPDDEALCRKLETCARAKGGLDLEVWTNEKNLGFIGSVNRALEACIARREDAILLNSDTFVFPGAVKEIRDVAYADPLIGFVSPRSNNATICTFPPSSSDAPLRPEEGYRRFREASGALPRFSYVPTAVGFCLHIRWTLLSDFGVLDAIFGRGYNEENDLIMRANRSGYRAVLANWAFVWHEGETSFGASHEDRNMLEERNARILAERYPEYAALVQDYFSSPEYRAEALLDGLRTGDDRKRRIAFDFSSFGTYHNGTFEAGKRLLEAASKTWPEAVQILVIISDEAWRFHQLGRLAGVSRIDPTDGQDTFAAVIRFGQPFEDWQVRDLARRSPVIGVFMLDPIAADCGNLRQEFEQSIWHFVLQWSDLVFANSEFTADQFSRRYRIGPNTELIPSRHSLALADYSEESDQDGSRLTLPDDFLLIVGNKFAHKGLIPAVERLASALPTEHFVALGSPDLGLDNVTALAVGGLSDTDVARCYARASCVIFPTHYEGFGFPILHALVRSKPVFVRRLPAFQEIAEHLAHGRENIHWFQTMADLVAMLRQGMPTWRGGPAVGEDTGWERSALEVYRNVERRMATAEVTFLAERLRVLETMFPRQQETPVAAMSPADAASRLGGEYCERLLRRLLSNRALFWMARQVWRLMRFRRPAKA
jgi:FkbM family methyltransferase